jgi:hypothetical protein
VRYDSIDFSFSELKRARVQNLASAPTSPGIGQIYFNTTSKLYYIWDGSGWTDLCKQGTLTSVTATGPISSTGGITPVISIDDSGVVAGTYTKLTVNVKGLVTAATTLSAADIPTLTHDKISDFDSSVRASTLNQIAVPVADVNMNGFKITGLALPASSNDAASKSYVDMAIQGLDSKTSVRVATTANITLSGLQTIDGIALAEGDKILVKNQNNAADNGIYNASANAWIRSIDADASSEITPGMYAYIEEGSINGSSGWVLNTTGTIVLGTTALNFIQFSGAGQINAGWGMYKEGNTLSVGGTDHRITANNDNIDIASDYIGQTSITTLGTISSGIWNASIIDEVYGGTGLNSYTKGDILYASNVNELSKLAANTTTTKKFLQMTSSTPSWSILADIDIPSALTNKTYNGLGISIDSDNFSLYIGNTNLTYKGLYSTTISATGITNVTLPTSGTLLSTSQLVTVAQGGTGAADAKTARANLECPSKFTQLVGDGISNSIVVTHNLGTADVVSAIRSMVSTESVMADIVVLDENKVRIDFMTVPAINQYKVVIIG